MSDIGVMVYSIGKEEVRERIGAGAAGTMRAAAEVFLQEMEEQERATRAAVWKARINEGYFPF